uniref:Uncharacterized protein n=1 Tax=Rhizophora mucronata TaxID=61149 RepID=A0A2P2LX31_RHIMU
MKGIESLFMDCEAQKLYTIMIVRLSLRMLSVISFLFTQIIIFVC